MVNNVPTRIGKVVSKNQKTLVVSVEYYKKHPKYGKPLKRHTKYHTHIEDEGAIELGDSVRIKAGRPMSRMKSWHFVERLEVK